METQTDSAPIIVVESYSGPPASNIPSDHDFFKDVVVPCTDVSQM